MTRPRLSRTARAEAAERQMTALERRIAETGALARLALTIQRSGAPQAHPRLAELMARAEALAHDRRSPAK
ncbi:MAG: hypothetical protein Q8L66_02810 [Caulobacter sp.]|nr:hypothetical protein [Caulobacter sp.]